ncbi:MAG: dihydroorotase [Treponema sp.]|nr:dihydroorotase [Treponema sp.]
MKNLLIHNARLVDSKIDSFGSVLISDGKIKSVIIEENNPCETNDFLKSVPDAEIFDAKGLTLMPSFIDMHAHFRYPGQTQKEDLDSGLNAATAGGFGTLVLMPNTMPVVSDSALAEKIMAEAQERNLARIFQTVSITKDFEGTDTSAIETLSRAKTPVISEDGHDVLSTAVMLDGMKKAGEKGIIVACHCEDVTLAQTARPYRQKALALMKENDIPAGKITYKTDNVPESVNLEIDSNLSKANELLALAEDAATERNIEIAKLAACHVHICHCSTKISMDAVRRAKSDISQGITKPGFRCTVEVTPHHLSLTGTTAPYIRALVNPPLRNEADRRAVIEALRDGTADCIGTDHAPHTLSDKAAGSPGFTGLETAFATCNTVLCKEEGFSISRLSELMSDNAAKILGIKSGRLLPGYNADLVLVDQNESMTVTPSEFKSKGKSTPIEGKTLTGRVKATFFGGARVFG